MNYTEIARIYCRSLPTVLRRRLMSAYRQKCVTPKTDLNPISSEDSYVPRLVSSLFKMSDGQLDILVKGRNWVNYSARRDEKNAFGR